MVWDLELDWSDLELDGSDLELDGSDLELDEKTWNHGWVRPGT